MKELNGLVGLLGLLFPGLGSLPSRFSSRRGIALSFWWTVIIIVIIIAVGAVLIYLLLTQPSSPTY